MSRPIRIRIGQLVLHGFDPRDRHAIGDAVRAELTRLVEAGAAPPPADPNIAHVRDVHGLAAHIAGDTHRAVQPRIDAAGGKKGVP